MNSDFHGATTSLAADYIALFPEEAAAELESVAPPEIARFLATCPTERAAAVLGLLRSDIAAATVTTMGETEWKRLLPVVDPARAVVFLARLDDSVLNSILSEVDRGTARELETLMSYPADTAGSIMDPRVAMLRADATADHALQYLRGLRKQRIYNVHVVDRGGRYIGSVPLLELAIADPEQELQGMIASPPVAVQATASQTEVVELIEKLRIPSLPVVDFDGHLIGLIRSQALTAAVEQEATADIQSMVGASRDERALSPVPFAVRKRLPWLEVNLATAFLAASVVGLFESTIARFTALAVLLPVVAGQSGNTGAQALAVTMRGLALREIGVRHWLRVAVKEFKVAFINGIAVAVTTAAAVFLWSRSSGLTLVIGVSMVLSMAAAGLAGAAIPMFLTAIHQDPAQSSSIILTTITDVVGFFSFLGIATLLAGML